MNTPTTAWDRAPTDSELNRFYGKNKPTAVRDEIIETITKTVRIVSAAKLGLPYVTNGNSMGSIPKVAMYPLSEVVTDYGSEKAPLAALLAVLEKSDCLLVAEWRMALAARFADSNADDVEELTA